jgi:predicted ester cyclase
VIYGTSRDFHALVDPVILSKHTWQSANHLFSDLSAGYPMSHLPPVLRTYIDGLRTHDVDKVASAVSDDLAFISSGRTLNKSEFLDMLRALYLAFPDWSYDHSDPELRGDVIAIKWRQAGTHSGTLAMPGLDPISATGRTVAIPEQYFYYRVRGERIVEIRPDPVPGGAPRGILEQIGIETPPL